VGKRRSRRLGKRIVGGSLGFGPSQIESGRRLKKGGQFGLYGLGEIPLWVLYKFMEYPSCEDRYTHHRGHSDNIVDGARLGDHAPKSPDHGQRQDVGQINAEGYVGQKPD